MSARDKRWILDEDAAPLLAGSVCFYQKRHEAGGFSRAYGLTVFAVSAAYAAS